MKKILLPIVLIILSSLFFFYINSSVEPFQSWPSLKYTTEDSSSYINAGIWLTDRAITDYPMHSIAKRPFFYPLIVAGLEKIEPWAIIIFQFTLWQLQILMVYFCAKLISKSAITSFGLALFCATFLSPIGIALHVLTETTISFLLTLSLYTFLTYTKNKPANLLLLFYLLLLSLCSVTKPSYFIIFVLHTVIIFCIWQKKSINGILIASVILFPIITQATIMKRNFDTYKLSFISTLAINDYFLSTLELYTGNVNRDKNIIRQIRANHNVRHKYLLTMINKEGYKNSGLKVNNEFIQMTKQFPAESLKLFTDLILLNSRQPSYYLQTGSPNLNKLYRSISSWQSNIIRILNIFSLFAFMFMFITKRKKKALPLPPTYNTVNTLASTLIFFTYVTNGVTFWQGDRLLLPIYAISLIWFFYQFEAIRNVFFQSYLLTTGPGAKVPITE